ncbi:MAG: hemin uptake protein HemP [Mesorhizobium sp.]
MNTRPTFNHPAFDYDRRFREARPQDQRPVSPEPVRTVESTSLFHGDHEIGIQHRGSLYRLKITRQGKLILNK